MLRTWEFSETSQTVSLFTLAHGAIRGLAKGARRERSTFGGGFEPITAGTVVFRVRAASELALITEWNVEEIFWGPRTSLAAHRAALYASELIGAFITDREAHAGLFETAIHCLRGLDDPASVPGALVRLQWGVLVETGHRPRIDAAATESASARILGFDPEAGMVVADPGPGAGGEGGPIWRVRRETVESLRDLDGGNAGPSTVAAAGVTLDRTNRFLAACCRYHLGRELQTARIVFGNRLGGLPGLRRGSPD